MALTPHIHGVDCLDAPFCPQHVEPTPVDVLHVGPLLVAAVNAVADVIEDMRSIASDCETDLDRLHAIKRTVEPGEQRDALLLAIDRVQAVWAAAAQARTALRDAKL